MSLRILRGILFIFSALIINYDSTSYGQGDINNPIDPNDTETIKAVDFYRNYLAEFRIQKASLPDFTKYWSADDCKRYLVPDPELFGVDATIPTYLLGTPRILYARPAGNIVHIKTMFSRNDSNGRPLVISITNHYVMLKDHIPAYFINPTLVNSNQWTFKRIRNITYYYPSSHHFDRKKALSMAKKVIALEREWEISPVDIHYYFADTREEIEHFRGFDFTISMGNRDKPSGMSDGANNIVYCGGWGENYFHEVVHLYLNKYFPQSPLTEGLAVFYGGSMGHELPWHVKRLYEYLQSHREIKLYSLDDLVYLDNFTNPKSTILGLLCDKAYNAGRLDALKRSLNYVSLSALLQQEYKVEADDFDTFIRDLVARYALAHNGNE